MIARIEHERAEREALEHKRMELLRRKQKLIADNKKRKDDLANLDKKLEKFIDVCLIWKHASLIYYSHLSRLRNQSRNSSTRTCERHLFERLFETNSVIFGSELCAQIDKQERRDELQFLETLLSKITYHATPATCIPVSKPRLPSHILDKNQPAWRIITWNPSTIWGLHGHGRTAILHIHLCSLPRTFTWHGCE